MNNSSIPNYIYRWTEREVEKTIQSYAPYYEHNYKYSYATGFPSSINLEKNSILKTIFIYSLIPFYLMLKVLFPKQQNLFSFYIEKEEGKSTFPWLIWDSEKCEYRFNAEWAKLIYIDK